MRNTLTPAEMLAKINAMTHEEMARAWRFAPLCDPMFTDPHYHEVFKARFESLGGMTTEMSKRIGWGGIPATVEVS